MSFLRGITKVGGNLDPKIFKQLDGLTDTAKLRKVDDLVAANPNLAKQLDGLDDAAKLKKLDELGDASKISKVDDLADAGSKAKKSTFLSRNASTLLAGGVAAGGLYYLDQQYANAKKETKDCMKVCLPENWDDHVYGDLKSSELIYKELDNPSEQPVCTAQIEDCGTYCGQKCEEIHDYDMPGSDLLTGTFEDVGEGASNLFTSIFGDLGIDSTTMYASSSALSLCCCMMMVMVVVMK